MSILADTSGGAFMTCLIILVVYLALAGAAADIASKKGYSGASWFFLSLFLPVLALIIITVAPENKKELEKRGIKKGNLMKCPICQEVMKKGLNACFRCHHDFQRHKCPRCEAHFMFESRLAGQVIKCGACNRNFSYPSS